MSIKEYMTTDHRECDNLYAPLEEALNEGDFEKALELFIPFKKAMLKHFAMEEEVLFPKMEEFMGSGEGPIYIMKMEHAQIRSIIDQLGEAIEAKNQEKALGLGETFMIMTQQHNMKEEQILYNMAEQLPIDKEQTLEEMKKVDV
ncbi:hemerythrin domain-containing protein [Nitrosophilus labii]|uniref:hemerythrin domain-containing protein n=1 Tax=Nitrosophilus labii TaxID=2706014 RepID=UPI001657636A|nr:hemerythrin domain-containing protein [Nitrosophilus labii]